MWSEQDLRNAVQKSKSVRQVLRLLNLKAAGGNYAQVKQNAERYNIDISHFKGKAWNKGLQGYSKPRITLNAILVKGSTYQSHKLKKRLFKDGLKKSACELCGWAEVSIDGRMPVELDHINGDHSDNRLSNLRILCPNCHSLQVTHRGRNMARMAKWQTRNT